MVQNNKNHNFLSNRFTFGLVIRADFTTIQAIKKHISGYDDVDVIFQKLSASKLWIKEEGEPHE